MKIGKKVKILEALEEIVQQKRYDEVKVQDISNKAGVGKGTIYRYFHTKEELFLELSLYGLEQLNVKIEDLLNCNTCSTIELLRSFISIFANFGNSRKKMILIVREIEERKESQENNLYLEEYYTRLNDVKKQIDKYLASIIKKGFSEKLLSSKLNENQLSQFVIHSVFAKNHYHNDTMVSIKELTELLLKGMGYNE